MKRREFITLLGGAAVWPLAAHAQQPKVPTIGAIQNSFGGSFGRGCAIWGMSRGKTFDLSFDRLEDTSTGFPNWPPNWSVSKSI
jgi:hypothetical protein